MGGKEVRKDGERKNSIRLTGRSSTCVVEPTTSLDVYLVNGKQVTIELDSFDASDTALEVQ